MDILSNNSRQYLDDLDARMNPVDIRGAPTAQRIAAEESETGQRLGLSEAEPAGVAGEFARGSRGAFYNMASTWGRTFNAEGVAGWGDYKLETNRQLGKKSGEGWAQYAANVAGSAITQNVPLIASAYASGGLSLPAWGARGAMALTVFPSAKGSLERTLSRAAPNMAPEQKEAMSWLGGGGLAWLEVALGPQRAMGNEIMLQMAGRKGKNAVAEMIKTGAFRSGADSFFRHGAGMIKEELIEENLGALFEGMMIRSVNPDADIMGPEEFWRMQLDTVIGAGALAIGPGLMRSARISRMRALAKGLESTPTESDIKTAISVNGNVDGESYARFTSLLWGAPEGQTVERQPIISLYEQKFGRDAAEKLTTTLQNLAVNMAKHDSARTPLDYLNTFNQVFVDVDLTPEQVMEMRVAESDSERLNVLNNATEGRVRETLLSASSSIDEQAYNKIQSDLRTETETPQVTALVAKNDINKRVLEYKKPLAEVLGKSLRGMQEGREARRVLPTQEEVAEGTVPEGAEVDTAVADAIEALDAAIESNEPDQYDIALDKLYRAHSMVAGDIDAEGRVAVREDGGRRRAVVVKGASADMDEDTVERMYALGLMQNGSLIITKESLDEVEYALQKTEERAEEFSLEAQEQKTARAKLHLLLQQQIDENVRRRRDRSNHNQPLTDTELSVEGPIREALNLPDVRAREVDSKFYFSSSGQQGAVHGQYIPGYNLAVFYNKANVNDVLHEWMHHVVTKDLLPARYMDVLAQAYTSDEGDETLKSSAEFQEKLIGAVEAYLIEGDMPDGISEEHAEALRFIGRAAGETWGLVKDNEFVQVSAEGKSSLSINENVRKVFDEIFESPRIGDAEELAQIVARAIHVSSKLGDKGHGGVKSSDTAQRAGVDDLGELFSMDESQLDAPLFSQGRRVVPDNKLDTLSAKDLRQQIYIRKITDDTGLDMLAGGEVGARSQLTKEQLLKVLKDRPSINVGDMNTKAHTRYGKDYDTLTPAQKDQILRDVLRSEKSEAVPLEMQKVANRATQIAGEIVDTLESQPKDFSVRARGAGGVESKSRLNALKNEALIGVKNASRFGKDLMTSKFTDLYTIIDGLSDGNPDHPLWKIYGIINAGVRRKEMRKNHMMKWLSENGADEITVPWKKRIQIGDPRHPSGTHLHDVIGIYAVAADPNVTTGVAPVQQIDITTDPETGKRDVVVRGTDRGGGATALFKSNRSLVHGESLDKQVANFNEMLRNAQKAVEENAPAREFINLVRAYSKKALGDINAIRAKLGIKPMEARKGYLLPLMREGGTFHVDDMLHEAMELAPSKRAAQKNPTPFMLRRKEGARARPIYLNASDLFSRYQNQVDTYVAKKPTVLLSQSILKQLEDSGWFQDNEEMGALEALWIMSEREKFWNGRMTPKDSIEHILGTLRGNSFKSVLTMNIPSGLRQGVSVWDALTLLPAGQAHILMGNYIKFIKDVGKHLTNALTDETYTDYEIINPLARTEAYQTALKTGSRHIHAFWEIGAQDILSEGGSQGIVWSQKFGPMSVQDWAGSMQRWHDSITRLSVWWTAYNYKLNKDGATAEDAFDYAEEITLRTQPAADISERVGLQTGHELERSLAMYQSQLLKKTQLWRTEIIRPMMREWNKGVNPHDSIMRVSDALLTGRNIPGEHGSIAKRLFFLNVAPGLALGMIARGGPPDSWEAFVKDMFMYNITAVPLFGPLVAFKLAYGTFQDSGQQVYTELLDDIATLGLRTGQMVTPGGEAPSLADVSADAAKMAQYMGVPLTLMRPLMDTLRGEAPSADLEEIAAKYLLRYKDDDGNPQKPYEQWYKFYDTVGNMDL